MAFEGPSVSMLWLSGSISVDDTVVGVGQCRYHGFRGQSVSMSCLFPESSICVRTCSALCHILPFFFRMVLRLVLISESFYSYLSCPSLFTDVSKAFSRLFRNVGLVSDMIFDLL